MEESSKTATTSPELQEQQAEVEISRPKEEAEAASTNGQELKAGKRATEEESFAITLADEGQIEEDEGDGELARQDSGQSPQPDLGQVSPTQVPLLADPITQSYKSIIDVINRTSKGFKEGKKWKCVADSGCSSTSANSNHHHHHHHHRKRHKMTHSRTVDDRHLGGCSGASSMDDPSQGGSRNSGLARSRGRRLVRQKATTHSDDAEEQLLSPQASGSSSAFTMAEVVDEVKAPKGHHLRVQRGLPSRQWTVDACTGLKTPIQEALGINNSNGSGGSTAYLLRPVSRNSIMSNTGANDDATMQGRRISPSDRSRSPFPRSPGRERIRLGELCRSTGSSFNHSMDASTSSGGGGGARNAKIYERALLPHLQNPNQRRLQKQRTSESAPNDKTQSSMAGSARHLPRQHSNASAYSAVMPTSYSHQGITLVRGASCSLVDIPTYLGPTAAATGGVELAQMCDISSAICKTVPMAPASSVDQRKPTRPRLQLDLTRKKNTAKNNAKKTQWTVLCVSLTLLTLSVTLVGTMLSVGSQYQDLVIKKPQYTFPFKNQSLAGDGITEEPFVIVPDDIDLIEGDKEVLNKNSTKTPETETLMPDGFVPIIFPALENSKLLGLSKFEKEKRISGHENRKT